MAKFSDSWLDGKLQGKDYEILQTLVGAYLELGGSRYSGRGHKRGEAAETEENALKWVIRKSAELLEEVEEINDTKND